MAVLSFHLDSLTTGTSLGEHCPVNEILSQLTTSFFQCCHSLISFVHVLLPDVDCWPCLLPSVISHIWECCGLENDKLHYFLPVSPGGKDSTEAAAGVCGVHRIQCTAFDPGSIYCG